MHLIKSNVDRFLQNRKGEYEINTRSALLRNIWSNPVGCNRRGFYYAVAFAFFPAIALMPMAISSMIYAAREKPKM